MNRQVKRKIAGVVFIVVAIFLLLYVLVGKLLSGGIADVVGASMFIGIIKIVFGVPIASAFILLCFALGVALMKDIED